MNAAKLRPSLTLVALTLLSANLLFAGKKPEPVKTNGLVDEGTFAIFQNGKRVATENFRIRQYPSYSVTTSEIRLDSGQSAGVLEQSCELTLLPDGSLRRYEYKEDSPTVRSLTVEPSDQLLVMHSEVDGKKTEQPFLLTPSAFVLDDYFFATREVLLWRYMASSCRPSKTGDGCQLVRARFPVIVPSRNTSSEVYLSFQGYDDMPMFGRPQRLRHFVMQTEGPDWNLWVDNDYKLVRISIPAVNTEILRQEK